LKKVIKLAETVERQRAASHELPDCVQDAVKEKLQEDKEEMEDIKKEVTISLYMGLKKYLTKTAKHARKLMKTIWNNCFMQFSATMCRCRILSGLVNTMEHKQCRDR